MNQSTISYIIFFALIAWFLYSRLSPIRGLKTLKESDFREQLQQSKHKILIDVREPFEFQGGHVAGAVNFPLSQIKNRSKDIPEGSDVFLYCKSGMRSRQAGKILSKQGINNLSHLQGGIITWSGKTSK